MHDVAIQRLPVRFALDRAGLVGADGPTHAGSFDLAYLGCLPGFVLMAAADEAELKHMVATAVAIDDRPSAFRYPRGEGTGVELPAEGRPLEIGKGRIVREGSAVALLSLGTRLGECLKAADQLAALGLSATVADARFAKPLDTDLIRRLAQNHEVLITVEEGSVGGFGSFVLQYLAGEGLLDRGLKVRQMVLPDVFIDHDKPEKMYELAGLNAPDIVATVLSTLGREAARFRGRRARLTALSTAYPQKSGPPRGRRLALAIAGRSAVRPMQKVSLDQLSCLPSYPPSGSRKKPWRWAPGLLFFVRAVRSSSDVARPWTPRSFAAADSRPA